MRADKCLPLLRETVDDLTAAYVRDADAQDCIEHNTANVGFLEDQLQSLQRKLALRQTEKQALDAEIAALEGKVELANIAGPGLCIRTLNKKVLSHVLEYLDPSGGINSVCKYWAGIAAEIRSKQIAGPVGESTKSTKSALTQPPVLRRTKSEIKTDMAHIRSAKMLRELALVQAAQAATTVGGTSLPASQVNSPTRAQQQQTSKAGSAANGTNTPALSVASNTGAARAPSSTGEHKGNSPHKKCTALGYLLTSLMCPY
jgi:hypothetical protein